MLLQQLELLAEQLPLLVQQLQRAVAQTAAGTQPLLASDGQGLTSGLTVPKPDAAISQRTLALVLALQQQQQQQQQQQEKQQQQAHRSYSSIASLSPSQLLNSYFNANAHGRSEAELQPQHFLNTNEIAAIELHKMKSAFSPCIHLVAPSKHPQHCDEQSLQLRSQEEQPAAKRRRVVDVTHVENRESNYKCIKQNPSGDADRQHGTARSKSKPLPCSGLQRAPARKAHYVTARLEGQLALDNLTISVKDVRLGLEGARLIAARLMHNIGNRSSGGSSTSGGGEDMSCETPCCDLARQDTNTSVTSTPRSENAIDAKVDATRTVCAEATDSIHEAKQSEAAATNKEAQPVQTLSLTACSIGDDGIAIIAEALAQGDCSSQLHSLNLAGNYISDKGAIALAAALSKCSSLSLLNLSNNQVHAEGAKAIARAICDGALGRSLRSLSLFGNHVGPEGAAALAVALTPLPANKSFGQALTTLDLYANNVKDGGAKALASMLETNTTLTSLNLRDNRLGPDGAYSLADALKVNATLRCLDIRANSMSDDGACRMAEVLRSSKCQLRSLDLTENGLGNKGAVALAEALTSNAKGTLKTLRLGGNEVGESGGVALAEALNSNRTLSELFLEGNTMLGEKAIRALAETGRVRSTLSTISVLGQPVSAFRRPRRTYLEPELLARSRGRGVSQC